MIIFIQSLIYQPKIESNITTSGFKLLKDIEVIDTIISGRNGVMVSASDCHPKDRSSIPGQDTVVSTAVSQGESI